MSRVWLVGVCLLVLVACGGGGEGRVPPASPPASLHIQTATLPVARAGQAYAADVRAAGGTGVGNAWRIVSGELPAGLTFAGDRTCQRWDAWEVVGEIEPDAATGDLSEISGLAASRRNPGILWVHDDSGGDAVLHALAVDGTVRQRYRLDAMPRDWEDICLGPGPNPDLEYLYIGDIGDNGARRDYVILLRVEEPVVPALQGPDVPLPHEAFALIYPGGPRDAEALLVDWSTGAPYLLEKSESGGDAYRVPAPLDPSWTPTSPGTMTAVTTNRPLPPNVTAADAGRDATYVVYRTYAQAYALTTPSGGGLDAAFTTTPCPFPAPFVGQYEALALTADGSSVFTTTEHALAPLAPTVPLHRADAVPADLTAAIGGSTAAAGTWTFVVEVRDSSGATATRAFDLEVR